MEVIFFTHNVRHMSHKTLILLTCVVRVGCVWVNRLIAIRSVVMFDDDAHAVRNLVKCDQRKRVFVFCGLLVVEPDGGAKKEKRIVVCWLVARRKYIIWVL